MSVGRVMTLLAAVVAVACPALAQDRLPRPKVALVLSGGGAKGFAHVGVLQWFEENRIPVDVITGTSMGGLVGGAYATGMSAAELNQLMDSVDWNALVAPQIPYRDLDMRRKEARRDFPTGIEFGLKGGLRTPTGLNPAQGPMLLINQIALPYPDDISFDALATPFRCVATDLTRSEQLVFDRGSLSVALRSTMSIPGLFTAVNFEDRILVDGGVMNNLPTDVAKSMGAELVIAVDFGFVGPTPEEISSFIGVTTASLNALMIENQRRSLRLADLIIQPDVSQWGIGSFDAYRDIATAGYQAAERQRRFLLTLQASQEEWDAYVQRRAATRGSAQFVPAYVRVAGVPERQAYELELTFARFAGQPLDREVVDRAIRIVVGNGRYEAIRYERETRGGDVGLLFTVTPKTYGPPFLDPLIEIDGVQTDSPRLTLKGRLTTYDLGAIGSEFRVTGSIGSEQQATAEVFLPLGGSPVFFAADFGYRSSISDFYAQERFVSPLRISRFGGGVDIGVMIGRFAEVRAGYESQWLESRPSAVNSTAPNLRGSEQAITARLRVDTTNAATVPTSGARFDAFGTRVLKAPGAPSAFNRAGIEFHGYLPAGWHGILFATVSGRWLQGDYGSSLYEPALGGALRLGAFSYDQLRGRNTMYFNAGYLRQIGALPSFIGGKVYVGTWIETGSAYEALGSARFSTNLSGGLIAETPLGPLLLGGSVGPSGRRALYFTFGRGF